MEHSDYPDAGARGLSGMNSAPPRQEKEEGSPESGATPLHHQRSIDALASYTYSVMLENGVRRYSSHTPECGEVTGYAPEHYEKNPDLWYSMIHADDRPKVASALEIIMNGGRVAPLEHRLIRSDQTVVRVRNTMIPRFDESGACFRCDGLIEHIPERRVTKASRQEPRPGLERQIQARTRELITMNQDLEHRIENHKKAESALRKSEENFRDVFENAPIGIFRSTASGKLLQANPVFARMFGYEAPGDMIDSITDITTQCYAHPEVRYDVLRDTLAAEGWHRSENRFVRRSGEPFTATLSLRVVRDGNGINFEGFLENGAAHKPAEDTLKEAEAKCQGVEDDKEREAGAWGAGPPPEPSADRAESSSSAGLSHDILPPACGALGMVDMALSPGPGKEGLERRRERVGDSSSPFFGIINDILDLSKIEEGRLPLAPRETDLRSLLEEAVSLFRVLTGNKGLALHYEIGPDVPRLLVGDPVRIKQVLVNLVANAARFTDHGEVGIRVDRTQIRADAALESDGDLIVLLFSVRNTGAAVPEVNRDKVFENSERAGAPLSDHNGGTCPGLTISKRLIQWMGGEIWQEGNAGSASAFFFTIVFPQKSKKPVANSVTAGDDLRTRPDRPPLRLLLAEDNAKTRKIIEYFLSRAGHLVTPASNGMEVLQALPGESFDLILMDIQMPVMDGIETAKWIRKSSNEAINSKIPIIALTPPAMAGDRERLSELGMDAHVSKPIDIQELFSVVEKAARGISGRKDEVFQGRGDELNADPNALQSYFSGR